MVNLPLPRGSALAAALLLFAGCADPSLLPGPGPRSLRAERDDAVRRGTEWLSRYLDDPASADWIGVDAVRIFSEPADTLPDPVSRRRWHEEAAHRARVFRDLRLRPDVPWGPWDVLDVIEFATYADSFGVDPAPLVVLTHGRLRALPVPDAVYPLWPHDAEAFARATEQELLDLFLATYSVEKAALAGADYGLAFGLRDVLPHVRQRRFALPGEDGPGRSFRDSVYLAAHVAFVACDYGRVRLRREDAPWVYDYLFGVWPAVLAARDVELAAEIADVARSLGLSEEEDPILFESTRLLLDAQDPDGSWGPAGGEPTPYRAMHPTWCAIGGLRERLFLAGTAWESRIQTLLAEVAGG